MLPDSLPFDNLEQIIGDVEFTNPGGLSAEDYIPRNKDLIMDRGISIEKLPGDDKGLSVGLTVQTDFFGNPITGKPDIGAIELNVENN